MSNEPSPVLFPMGARSLEAALATRHVYQRDKMAYVSFNGMPEITVEPQGFESLSDLVANPLRPIISPNGIPYGAFVLQDPSPNDHQMAKLLFKDGIIPHVKSVNDQGREVYSLEKGTRESLCELETMLVRAVRYVNRVSPISQLLAPPLPWSFNYWGMFRSYEELSKQVLDARSAFHLYIAYTVYVVTIRTDVGSLQRDSQVSDSSRWPRWCEEAFKDGKLEKDKLKGLLFSQPFNFSSKRVGTFITPHTCTFLNEINFFLQAGIPFAVIWDLNIGDDGLWFPEGLSASVRDALLHKTSIWDSDSPGDWGQAVRKAELAAVGGTASSSNPEKEAVRVPPNAYHWMAFFSVREEETPVKFAHIDRTVQKYRQRRHNAIHLGKYKPGARVFLWEVFSKDPPLWTRTQIEGDLKNEQFYRHDPTERVYCELRNQWDLCKPMADGMPELQRPALRPPSDDWEPGNGVILEVDDEDLRPYLRHPQWKERHNSNVQSKSSSYDAQRLRPHPLPLRPAKDARLISSLPSQRDIPRCSEIPQDGSLSGIKRGDYEYAGSSSTAFPPLSRKRKRAPSSANVPSLHAETDINSRTTKGGRY